MKLGLDLRGGVHFLMEVDMDAALEKLIGQQIESFRSELREANIRYRSIRPFDKEMAEVVLRNESQLEQAKALLEQKHPDMVFTEVTRDGKFALQARFTDARIKEVQNYAVSQNITILRNRVNELGVAEPLVQRQGANRIVVELPGDKTQREQKKSWARQQH